MYKYIKNRIKKLLDPNHTETFTAYIKKCMICIEYRVIVTAKNHRDAYFKLTEDERAYLLYIDNGYNKKTKDEILNKKTLVKLG